MFSVIVMVFFFGLFLHRTDRTCGSVHAHFQAFAAAQLDDLYQVERWGDDPIAVERRTGVRNDIVAGARFLELLEGTRLRTKGEA